MKLPAGTLTIGTSSEPVVQVGVSVVADIGIGVFAGRGVFVGDTVVEVIVGARTASGVIVGEVEQAAKNNSPNRAIN